MLTEFLPHIILIALVGGAALLFIQKGSERRDLLFMGIAAFFAVMWMIAVTMIDYSVQVNRVPTFWLALSIDAVLPALFFVYVSVLALENYYSPETRILGTAWLPLALGLTVLTAVHLLSPELFYRNLHLAAPSSDRLHIEPRSTLRFSLGFGYFMFMAAAGYVLYGIARRFPRIVEAMQLPEAERRTRMLLTLGVLAVFWIGAFDVLPSLFSSAAPSFMRLIGPALGVAGAVYAMVLARALDPRAVFRSAVFYTIRLLVMAIPAILVFSEFQSLFDSLSPRAIPFLILGMVIVIDALAIRLKPMLDALALRKSYNSTEAINRYIHELLLLKGMRDFSQKVTRFVKQTLGTREVCVWVPPVDDPKAFHTVEDEERLILPTATREALIQRRCATMRDDLQLDPRMFESREELGQLFERLAAEVILPLVDEGRLVGLVTLSGKESFDEYYDQDLRFLDRLTDATALSLLNALQYEIARTGKPIKVYSRSELEEHLARHWQQARRHSEAVSLALFRLSDSNAFDTAHGIGSAAVVTEALGNKLRPTLRARDLPAYFDEHTLALFMPHTHLHGAEVAGRRIRRWLDETEVEINGKPVRAGFILGLAARTDDMEEPTSLLQAAEDALTDNTAVVNR